VFSQSLCIINHIIHDTIWRNCHHRNCSLFLGYCVLHCTQGPYTLYTVHCFTTAPCIIFRYRSLYYVSLPLLVSYFTTAPCIIFRYRSLYYVSLPLLVSYFAIVPCTMFRYRSLYHVSLPLLVLCFATAPCTLIIFANGETIIIVHKPWLSNYTIA
jgi:hypothetical protein